MPQMLEKGHFATVCQLGKKPLLTLGDDENDSEEECYDVSEGEEHVVSSTDKKSATCLVNRQHKVTFEIDTGAPCNVYLFLIM